MVRFHEIVAEFLGTFILVLTVGCNVLSGNTAWGGVSVGSALMVCVYGLAPISGANFNPAVSVALGLVSSMGLADFEFPWKKVVIYTSTQCLAAVVAAVGHAALFRNSFRLQPGAGFGWVNAGRLVEFFYTFMLCFVVLNVAVSTSARKDQNQFFGLAIGFVIVAGAYGGGVVSGGCFNPALALGAHFAIGFDGHLAYLVYAFCQLLGAGAAARLFKVVRPWDFGGAAAAAGGAQKAPQLVAEFLGSFVLVLTVGLNVLGQSTAGAFSIAAALMSMIYALGDVSGAHFNPAVTVAVAAIAQHKPKDVIPYVAAQALGGFSAALTYSLIYAGAGFPLTSDPTWARIALAEATIALAEPFKIDHSSGKPFKRVFT
ncbi:unnamed protein product [Prorocentrum cordatum]|uniref:Aquaporin n=2 Tax=Prorocentrum cordatum TaxID=2364126 RepID=A0ABN9UDE6_9DINO|nr:unnamed protein product [Polarella glacialis]